MAVGREVHAASEFRLEGVKEGFGMRVITWPADVGALLEPERDEPSTKRSTHVLRPTIAVKDHAVSGAGGGGLVEGTTDDGRGAASREGPPENAPRVLSHHNRQVSPTAVAVDKRDVSDPVLIDARDCQIPQAARLPRLVLFRVAPRCNTPHAP